MPTQACPNCSTVHDVGVYVSGQRVLCRCGIHFDVKRTDVSTVGRPAPVNVTVAARNVVPGTEPAATKLEPNGRPAGAADGASMAALAFAPTAAPSSRGNTPPAPALPAKPASGIEVTVARPALQIPGYDLIEILGRGGMGEVWRAHQKSLQRTVAVKVLPPHLAADPEFVTRFDKEATALASLSHPNIIQIIDRGVAGEHYFFVMELVVGRSLRDLLAAGPLPVGDALRLVVQICRAIDYAHEKLIIHRDLKPENILIDDRGHVKVADFGLAGIQGSEARLQLTATSVAMGTVNYMAPEQRRDAKSVDGRADLYSLGVMLYEMLTGELPIGRFKLPSERIPGLDKRLDGIVAKALEADREARYQRASGIGQELEQLLGTSSSSQVPRAPGGGSRPTEISATPPPGTSQLAHKPGGWKVGIAVLGVLVALAVVMKLWPGQQASVEIGGSKLTLQLSGKNAQANGSPRPWPANTQGELFSTGTWSESGSIGRLALDFVPAPEVPPAGLLREELNVHDGRWRLEGGGLRASQGGNELGPDATRVKLVPRAYVAHRYFSAEDFTAEVDMSIRPLEADYPAQEEAQHFGEVAFRIKDVQVSVFAIPDAGMRLLWRYFTPDGVEISGNSAREVEEMVEDETPVPTGRFKVRLSMKRVKSGVEVVAAVNGVRFARKVLPGLQGQIGKVALGCRNLHCDFDRLVVSGKFAQRPAPSARRVE